MNIRNNPKPSIAANARSMMRALLYASAARKHEQTQFPYTAAMEWRLAAELFGSNTLVGSYFWHRWERIMHVPRLLAGPITDFQTFALLPDQPALVTQKKTQSSIDRVPFVAAA